ncbi:MAG: adenosylcobinamide amidohydrolase [Cypionkella sp.]|jgi:adenosylcobinamide amidohydrolase|nr:adenosylcobinamide amidohydrolase [Cypionkella sp.]
MIGVHLNRPWLVADLGRERRILSFAPHRPGCVSARHVVWREVRDADLSPEFDVLSWLPQEFARQGHAAAVGLLTSRDVGSFVQVKAEVDGVRVAALVTLGLGNAESVGSRRAVNGVGWSTGYGTINICALIDAGLTEAALIEALTIAAEARTAAVMDCGLTLPDGRRATGTGTDCIALAADVGDLAYAGTHTAVGEALGKAVREAVTIAARTWIAENGGVARGYP